jgi:hypothetical protein
MLPVTLQFIIVMIASAINDRLQRKLDYVEEERRILREQVDAATGGKKLSFTTEQRRRLATAGKLLTPVPGLGSRWLIYWPSCPLARPLGPGAAVVSAGSSRGRCSEP